MTLVSFFYFSREVNIDISVKAHNDTDSLAITCYNKLKEIYKKDYSEIYSIYYGIHVSQIVSLDDGLVLSNTPEPFSIINLPIPQDNKNPSIIDCFELYLMGEILEGENAWYNEKTKIRQSIKKQIVFTLKTKTKTKSLLKSLTKIYEKII